MFIRIFKTTSLYNCHCFQSAVPTDYCTAILLKWHKKKLVTITISNSSFKFPTVTTAMNIMAFCFFLPTYCWWSKNSSTKRTESSTRARQCELWPRSSSELCVLGCKFPSQFVAKCCLLFQSLSDCPIDKMLFFVLNFSSVILDLHILLFHLNRTPG